MCLVCLLLLTGCALFKSPETQVVVIPSERVIKALPNGNYEVTPAWLKERYEYEAWITEQLEGCRVSGVRKDPEP